ncbi:MAG: fumarylacetoacetate hydrolase family protein [Weeksellaceae bacterium]|nr:fumarylacetoacetate hydrolase family protein [Weeksellaceae bacterium]
MKALCIGRNYVLHAKELNNEVPEEPVVFIKPETAIFYSGAFEIPDFSNNLQYEVELVVKIASNIKNVDEKQADNSWEEIALGIDFTARDLQQKLKEKGLPWEKAKAFDQSAFVSPFVPRPSITDIEFALLKNAQQVQKGNTSEMLFSINQLIAHCSKYFTLQTGDLLFTGTPAGVGRLESGDRLQGQLMGKEIFELEVI